MKKRPLKIPVALAFVTVTTVAVGTMASCDDDDQEPSCQVYCVYETADNGNCPFPTCATGSNLDQCPAGCIPEPLG